jgi:hypothetical protein
VSGSEGSLSGPSPYTTGLALVTAKTEIHEIGHSFSIGEADDRTVEPCNNHEDWSIMTTGWDDDLVIAPMNGRYFAYSIEELLTIDD